MPEKFNGYNIPEGYSPESKELIEQGFGWTPDRAIRMLENLGYERDSWEEAERKGVGSHEWRAYVKIARGDEVHLLGILTRQIREEEDGLPPVR